MRVANYQFSPKLWSVLLYLTLVLCMLALGNWQMNRAALKVSFQESVELARQSSATPIVQLSDWNAEASVYRRVVMTGDYDVDRQFLWDNRTLDGVAGFEVILPMRMPSGEWILLNRGWIAPGPSRSELPNVHLPANAATQSVTVEGLLSQPSKGFSSGDAVMTGGGWPRILQYFDYAAISRFLEGPVLPVVVQVQSLGVNGRDTEVYAQRPEWLRANWEPAASGPMKHYSYAFQWFAMAFALTIIFIVVNTRKSICKPADI